VKPWTKAAIVVLLTWPPMAAVIVTPAFAATNEPQIVCQFSDQRLTEISGITWSRKHPGVYWVHNDSSDGPYIYAIDGKTCRTLAQIRIGNIGARDLEAIATGVDPRGQFVLWLGDIGDNNDSWPSVRLHAITEPDQLVDQQVLARTYPFTYADGSHNAESILADPLAAHVWVVTKQMAAGSVWSVPLAAGITVSATMVGDVNGLVTDAAMSPDGKWYVIRDYLGAMLHRSPVTVASVAVGQNITLPFQPQGEAITFTADGSALLVAGERDNTLWRVALPSADEPVTAVTAIPALPSTAPSTVTPVASDSASATAKPTAPANAAPANTGSADSAASPSALSWLIAGLAIVSALGIAISAARRMRR
jgi:hypothetical protein